MGTSSLAALAGMGLFAMLVMLVVYILVGALILSVSFRLVVGFMPSYLRALAAVVLAWIATFVVSLVLRMILPASAGGLLSLAALFLVGAAVVNYLLLAADGSQIGYGKACVVQLVYMVIGFVLALLIGFIVMSMFGAALLGH
ncbi:hypothetical protein [Rhodanobacter lindaniclasticus]|jgi:hypothetical protein|uniref:Uncharacterized protein n=1 Tax=Rhodanobacter lindaniclasticus TaxID=75310 RepID=A0A4S3KGA2_9GAMM|nr:hypothetical protein [Rhodanobacter lindaniclasticus]THD07665.1 hypothetical protein B1991_08525 [Rhodanobacter lindaniclasticus]